MNIIKTQNIDLEKENSTENMLEVAKSFITWQGKLYKEMRGGKLMYDALYYKWLDESELLSYYMVVRRILIINKNI